MNRKHIKTPLFYLLLAMVCLSACTKSTHLTVIPHNATFVGKANMVKIGLKIPRRKAFINEVLGEVMGNESKDNFGEMKNTGINFLTPYIFGGKTALNKGYFAIALPLNNAKKLEEFILKMDKTARIQVEKTVKYMELGNGNILGWNTKNLLFLTSVKLKDNRNLKEELFRLHNLSGRKMLLSANKNFKVFQKTKSDMGLWLNMAELNKTKTIQLITSKADLTDNYSHVFTNYKKGKIEMEVNYFAGDSTQQSYNNLFKSAITSKLVNSIPLDNPLLLAATSFSMEGIKQLLKDKKLYARVDKSVRSLGTNFQELTNMLNGELVFGLSDIRLVEREKKIIDEYTKEVFIEKETRPVADFVIAAGVENEAVYKRLMKTFLQSGMVQKDGGHYTFYKELFMIEKNKVLYFTNNARLRTGILNDQHMQNSGILQFMQGKSGAIQTNAHFASKLGQSATFMKILRDLKFPAINNIRMYFTNEDKKTIQGKCVINFKNKSENALVVLFNAFKKDLLKSARKGK
ncbi:hypothetical protein [uncultured Microscilla sp.]|uniref:hypothetical protein n=1 Tax=uncultured Microscilla sp. TaxID=432653 RepID=UPI0026069F1F|nr:hypothetical protein [uncultured Microscilla sp.]